MLYLALGWKKCERKSAFFYARLNGDRRSTMSMAAPETLEEERCRHQNRNGFPEPSWMSGLHGPC